MDFKAKKYFLIFFLSLIVSLLLSPWRMALPEVELWSIKVDEAIFYAVYLLCTIYWLRHYRGVLSEGGVVAAVVAGMALMDVVVMLIGDYSGWFELAARMLAVLSGWAYVRVSSKVGRGVVILSSILAFGLLCSVVKESISSKYFYGTFDGMIEQSINEPFILLTEQGDTIDLRQAPQDYIVLDFFSSSCGICFKEMPKVQRLHDQLRNDPTVTLYPIFAISENRSQAMFRDETYATGGELLRELGYSMPSLAARHKSPLMLELGVTSFPKVMIYQPSTGRIVYKGTIERAAAALEKLQNKR